jgi:hypothetical protein
LGTRRPEILTAATEGLLVSLLVYGTTIIVGFACGGLSRRDNLLTFVVSTYWSLFVGLVGLAILMVLGLSARAARNVDQLISTSVVLLGLIIIASIVVNLYGKTRGIGTDR